MNAMTAMRFLMVALGFMSTAVAVEVGQTWDEVVSELGKPINRLNAAGRSIGRWDNLEVSFENGRVTTVISRDLKSEAASDERRKQAAEAVQKLREEAEAANRRNEALNEERSLAERERKVQEAKVLSLELQLEAERAKLRQMTERAEAERKDGRAERGEVLKKEITLLQLDVQTALTKGEVQKASRLQASLLAKTNELKSLEK